ncbi:FAD-dependent oxidoreductase [Haladaptatus sp. T7]|uniref:FAD-dependent oxidoreductase n=1 Tax=Haladaptatus sp. T7 TaxID=2029368 RepID=UPI0021A25909|nr:FAD-dependent oxidoreductase [Haladaptatus sp. T7]GKZ13200.1 NADH oxidase [Haladaptatus sp. T7]
MGRTFVVVGGDAAGMSAASKAKRDDPDLEVVVFEKGEWVSYGACGLPYYVKGEIESLDDLVTLTPEEFAERGIDLRQHHEVVSIEREEQTVTAVHDGERVEQSYDDLLVATGARAIVPPIEGADLDGVFTLHSMNSAAAVKRALSPPAAVPDDEFQEGYGAQVHEYLAAANPDSVGIIGGGYIGLEMAEAFDARDMDVHVFEMLPHVLAPFGEDVAEKVEGHLESNGVGVSLDTMVERIVGEDGRVTGIEADGETVPVDVVLVATGVAPNAELAGENGVELGETGAIATDEYGRTNDENVFAGGDCAEARNAVTGEPDYVPLALTANRAGRAIGQTVTGTPTPVGDIVGTAVVKVFDLEAARTGVIDHEIAEAAGYDPVSQVIEQGSRAHYYPGGSPITVRLTADRESGRLLGASMVGREGVAQRINTVATALHAEMTVDEVEYLDLAYAPPFGPVWDPVLTAAKVLHGKLD